MGASHTVETPVRIPHAHELYIAGGWVPSSGTASVDVISPSTGEAVGRVADPCIDDAESAVVAARQAFDSGAWSDLPVAERIATCRRFCDSMEGRFEELNAAWGTEAGATITYCETLNNGAAASVWADALEKAVGLDVDEHRSSQGSEVSIRRLPAGVVLGILTYNAPVIHMGMKVIPALLAGCPVIIKHAPESQITSRIVAECADSAGFPAGVVSFLAAGAEVSRHLVAHNFIDMVSFTGGTEIAVDVIKQTADRIARTVLELGGKSPAILLDDADVSQMLETFVPGSCGFSGQVCVSLSRVLAPRSRYEEIVAALGDAYANVRIGDPSDRRSDIGPLASERARDRVERSVELAVAEGAKIVTGGRRPTDLDAGFYFEPTLLRDVSNEMTIAQEEIFGPVCCVIPYEDADDAVRIANDTKFGLAASVYSIDSARALEVAKRLRSGTAAINAAGMCLTEPFGGVKQSGWGRECGLEGILEFTSIQQIMLSGSYQA